MGKMEEILHATFTAEQRRELAKSGAAMSDGGFPIRNASDLQNAIQAVGRASGGEEGRNAVRRHIIARAKALGLSDKIPDTWKADGTLEHSDVDEALEHHGIKGMKWGVRRRVDPSTGLVPRTSSADQIHVDRIAKKLHSGGVSALSNRDLQDFSTRINREQEFNRALSSQEAQRAKPFIQRFLATQGKKQLTRVVDKAIDVAVEKALEEAGIRLGKRGANPDAADLLVKTSKRLQPKKK